MSRRLPLDCLDSSVEEGNSSRPSPPSFFALLALGHPSKAARERTLEVSNLATHATLPWFRPSSRLRKVLAEVVEVRKAGRKDQVLAPLWHRGRAALAPRHLHQKLQI